MPTNTLSFYIQRLIKKTLSSLLLFAAQITHSRDVVVIINAAVKRGDKEALLILPGFGSKIHGSKHQKKYFSNKTYDLFIPTYIGRKSMAQTVGTLDAFINKHHLNDYKKIHVFGYIVGSWAINMWIKDNPNNNIATIIYDRSPLQERAPYVFVNSMRLVSNVLAGPIMDEFSTMPYPPLEKKNIRIGLLVENKATKLIRKYKDLTLSLGALRWDLAQFDQQYDDAFYTLLNHDELYKRFDIVGSEILHFIQNGQFSTLARRVPYEGDPFVPDKKALESTIR